MQKNQKFIKGIQKLQLSSIDRTVEPIFKLYMFDLYFNTAVLWHCKAPVLKPLQVFF